MTDRDEIEELKAELEITRAFVIALTVLLIEDRPQLAKQIPNELNDAGSSLPARERRAMIRIKDNLFHQLEKRGFSH